MLVYEEYFNAGVSIYISHITIFTFATNGLYAFLCHLDKICYNVDFFMTKNYVNSVKFIHRNFEMLSKKKKNSLSQTQSSSQN